MLRSAEMSEGAAVSVEWPTVGLLGALYGGWLALVWFHDTLPLPAWLVLAGLVSALWGSAQHELIHGHPTRSRQVNAALGTPPVWLWLPFERYRRTHLTHHRDERLTDPLDDPESRYLTPASWDRLGPVGRALVTAQATLAGRLALGPFWAVGHFLRGEWRAVRRGDRVTARIWAWHLLWVALLLGFAVGVAGLPLWQYLLGFVWVGTAVALIRSFAEHRAHETPECRTAIVESRSAFAFLFLNNNLHLAHHRWPGVAWYRLPALYRAHREELARANGGLIYRGYRDVFRRFLLRPHDLPVHPLGRAPGRAVHQDGTA
jgi:fatty acid desaturase